MCQAHAIPLFRGLQIRIDWGIAQGLFDEEGQYDPLTDTWREGRVERLNMIERDAFVLGLHDYHVGVNNSPVMFADTRELTRAWKNGRKWAAETEEMENCPGCEGGDPCPTHG